MREFHKLLDVTAIRPNDWVHDSRIVCMEEGMAKVLTSFTQEEKHLIFKRRILVLLPRKGGPLRRNRFSEEDKSVFWLIKDKEGRILGPFTSKEMQDKGENGELTDLAVKRDDDKDFIDFNKLSKAVRNAFDVNLYEKFLNEAEMGQVKPEKDNKMFKSPPSGSRYDILFVDEETPSVKVEETKPFLNNFSSDMKEALNEKKNVFNVDKEALFGKAKAFLKQKNCQIEVQNIVQRIKGKTRANAINIVCFLVSSMNKQDCELLIDLITNEPGKDILADTDDGFVKVFKKNTRR